MKTEHAILGVGAAGVLAYLIYKSQQQVDASVLPALPLLPQPEPAQQPKVTASLLPTVQTIKQPAPVYVAPTTTKILQPVATVQPVTTVAPTTTVEPVKLYTLKEPITTSKTLLSGIFMDNTDMFYNQAPLGRITKSRTSLGIAPLVAGAITVAPKILAFGKKIVDLVGKLGVGGVTQDRFLNRRDVVHEAMKAAGYTGQSGLMEQYKILAADIPDRLTDRTYAKEFLRLHDYIAARLNRYNPGLGTYWSDNFPFVMKNKGNIFAAPIKIVKDLVTMFPPGTYKGEKPFPPLTNVQPAGDLPAGVTEEERGLYTYLKDAQGAILQIRDDAGNIVQPNSPQYTQAINTPAEAGMGNVGGIVLAVIGVSALAYMGSKMSDAKPKKTAA